MEEKNHTEQAYEQRMYFFVAYQLMPIQKGIQAGHAALEYANEYGHTSEYRQFIENDKTWIILNGGTTNCTRDLQTGERIGTLDQIVDTLEDMDIPHSTFTEPDLNNTLTAVCFLCDERVFNHKDYPMYEKWAEAEYGELYVSLGDEGMFDGKSHRNIPGGQIDEEDVRQEYENLVGGKNNVILKEIINGKPLAV